MAQTTHLKQGPLGIIADLVLGIDGLRLLLEWPPVRRILVMSELGQAVDFALEHWERPGWLADPLAQILIIVIGFTVIVWDARRPTDEKLLSSPRQMIIGGLIIIVIGVVVIGVGIRRQSTSTPFTIGTSAIGDSNAPIGESLPHLPQAQPGRPTIPHRTYTERDIREMLDALGEAHDLVEKKLMPLWAPIQNRLINPVYFLTQLGLKQTIAGLSDSKNTLQEKVWPPINNFVYQEHRGYEDQMRIALALDQGAARGELTRAIQVIIDRLQMLQENPDKIEPKTVGLVQPEYEKASQQSQQFWQWLVMAQSRIKEMENNLRDKGVTGYEAP